MTRLIIIVSLAAALAACASSERQAQRENQGEAAMATQTGTTNKTTFTTPSDTEIGVQHTFDAPRARVWDAWTKCEHLRNWMLGPPGWTMSVCEIDLRTGGAQRLAWRGAEGGEMEIRATYQEVTPPHRIIARESWGGPWPETTNTLTFTEDRGRTTMHMTIRYPSNEAREAALQTGMNDGMAHTFDRAADYIAQMR